MSWAWDTVDNQLGVPMVRDQLVDGWEEFEEEFEGIAVLDLDTKIRA